MQAFGHCATAGRRAIPHTAQNEDRQSSFNPSEPYLEQSSRVVIQPHGSKHSTAEAPSTELCLSGRVGVLFHSRILSSGYTRRIRVETQQTRRVFTLCLRPLSTSEKAEKQNDPPQKLELSAAASPGRRPSNSARPVASRDVRTGEELIPSTGGRL